MLLAWNFIRQWKRSSGTVEYPGPAKTTGWSQKVHVQNCEFQKVIVFQGGGSWDGVQRTEQAPGEATKGHGKAAVQAPVYAGPGWL